MLIQRSQTHNVALAGPVADFVVDMGSNGRIISQGSFSSALARDTLLVKELENGKEEMKDTEFELDKGPQKGDSAKQSAGKLVLEEETEIGHVVWASSELVCLAALVLGGANAPFAMFSAALFGEPIEAPSFILPHCHWIADDIPRSRQYRGEDLGLSQSFELLALTVINIRRGILVSGLPNTIYVPRKM